MQLSLDKVAMPARLTPSKPMTDAELLEFCATNDFYQIEREPNGDLSIMAPSGGSTSHRNVYIARMLDEWAEKFGGVAFDSNAGFVLPDGSMRSPDAAWIEAERWYTHICFADMGHPSCGLGWVRDLVACISHHIQFGMLQK